MDVAQLRQQIPACRETVYMNTGWSGPSPATVVEAVRQRLEMESALGPTSPPVLEGSRQVQGEARAAMAGLLNVTPEEVALTQSTTEGLNIVVNGLPWRRGDEVITFSLEHSSVLVPAYYLARRHGVSTRVLPLSPDEDHDSILEKVEAALTPRTRLLFLSHVQYTSGLRMPAEALRALTAPRGVWMLLDGAQTAGHIALDLRALGCEFYAMPGHKWLLGPDGVGALYIRRDMVPQVEPWKVSGHAAARYDGQGLLEPERDSVRKYELTTTSTALWAGLIEAVRFHRAAGPADVEARALGLAARARAALAGAPGLAIRSPVEGPGCSGLVTFTLHGKEPAEVVRALWEEERVVSRQVRELNGVRLSLDFFNTEEEVDRVAERVRRIAAR